MMRKLSIDGQEYIWRVYRRRGRNGAQVFMAAPKDWLAAPLRILFEDAEGYPERVGIVMTDVNLHLPRNAEMIIRHAIATQWQPASAGRPLEIQDGPAFIRGLPFTAPDTRGTSRGST